MLDLSHIVGLFILMITSVRIFGYHTFFKKNRRGGVCHVRRTFPYFSHMVGSGGLTTHVVKVVKMDRGREFFYLLLICFCLKKLRSCRNRKRLPVSIHKIDVRRTTKWMAWLLLSSLPLYSHPCRSSSPSHSRLPDLSFSFLHLPPPPAPSSTLAPPSLPATLLCIAPLHPGHQRWSGAVQRSVAGSEAGHWPIYGRTVFSTGADINLPASIIVPMVKWVGHLSQAQNQLGCILVELKHHLFTHSMPEYIEKGC